MVKAKDLGLLFLLPFPMQTYSRVAKGAETETAAYLLGCAWVCACACGCGFAGDVVLVRSPFQSFSRARDGVAWS